MIYFNKSLKCKICDKPGRSIYSKSYGNEILKFFFINYYGKKRYQRFKHKIKNTRYELLKCNDCELKFLRNILNANAHGAKTPNPSPYYSSAYRAHSMHGANH